ncbi:hypothetical protein BT69DRAFT_1300767 [Atractiella rhizophila]|nr:hypothetical protein BT69DRAFT_1300767 [Atractiella rhizophila]
MISCRLLSKSEALEPRNLLHLNDFASISATIASISRPFQLLQHAHFCANQRHHNYPRPVDVIGSGGYPYKYQIKYQLYQRDLFRFARVAKCWRNAVSEVLRSGYLTARIKSKKGAEALIEVLSGSEKKGSAWKFQRLVFDYDALLKGSRGQSKYMCERFGATRKEAKEWGLLVPTWKNTVELLRLAACNENLQFLSLIDPWFKREWGNDDFAPYPHAPVKPEGNIIPFRRKFLTEFAFQEALNFPKPLLFCLLSKMPRLKILALGDAFDSWDTQGGYPTEPVYQLHTLKMTAGSHYQPTLIEEDYRFILNSSLRANSIQTFSLVARRYGADEKPLFPDDMFAPLASNLSSATFIDMSTKANVIIAHAPKLRELVRFDNHNPTLLPDRMKAFPADASIERIWDRYVRSRDEEVVSELVHCVEMDSKGSFKHLRLIRLSVERGCDLFSKEQLEPFVEACQRLGVEIEWDTDAPIPENDWKRVSQLLRHADVTTCIHPNKDLKRQNEASFKCHSRYQSCHIARISKITQVLPKIQCWHPLLARLEKIGPKSDDDGDCCLVACGPNQLRSPALQHSSILVATDITTPTSPRHSFVFTFRRLEPQGLDFAQLQSPKVFAKPLAQPKASTRSTAGDAEVTMRFCGPQVQTAIRPRLLRRGPDPQRGTVRGGGEPTVVYQR